MYSTIPLSCSPPLLIQNISHRPNNKKKEATAATAGDSVRLEINRPAAAKAQSIRNRPREPVKSLPISRLVPNQSVSGIRLIMPTMMARNSIMPRYFPSTISVMDTGDDINRLSVFSRRSALRLRMLITGTTISNMKATSANNGATTQSLTPGGLSMPTSLG